MGGLAVGRGVVGLWVGVTVSKGRRVGGWVLSPCAPSEM